MHTQVLSKPSGEQWQSVLDFRQLPILAETRQALQQKLKSPALTFSSLTPIIESDPALCWHLLQVAAEQNPDCREQLHSAAGCLSLIGLQSFVKLVKSIAVSNQSQTTTPTALIAMPCTPHTLLADWPDNGHDPAPPPTLLRCSGPPCWLIPSCGRG